MDMYSHVQALAVKVTSLQITRQQLAEAIPQSENLQGAPVSSLEFLLQTNNSVTASCLPVNVPENVLFQDFRTRAKTFWDLVI